MEAICMNVYPIAVSGNSIYDTNRAIVARKFPDQVATLDQFPITNVMLFPNPKGHLVGQGWDLKTQQWVQLCDIDDPVSHAEVNAEQLYTPDCKVFVLLGIGLGYFASALARRLKPQQYEALWLHYGEGLDIEQVSRVMRKTRLNIRVLLHRARQELRQRLSRSSWAGEILPGAPAGASETRL